MTDLIPESLRQRKKVPFFHGEDLRYTGRMMYGLLCAQGGALIDEAVAAAPDVLDGDAIRRILAELPADPEMEAVDALVRVINTGLLQAMARAQQPLVAHENPMPVREVVGPEWPDLQAQVGLSLVARAEKLHDDAVVCFAPGVLLVRCEGGDGRTADVGAHYILTGNTLSYIIEQQDAAWARFLGQVDGKRTVAQILSVVSGPAVTGAERSTMWKHLEEALEHDVLQITNAAAAVPASG
jgi:hypothetical protein